MPVEPHAAPERIWLSVPDMGGTEEKYICEAFASNWLTTVGANLDAFERDFGALLGGRHAVALSSGTAAIHLGLRLLGVAAGDEVICPMLTFVASVNPVVYQGARPVFVDSERASWNMDANLLADCLKKKAGEGKLPRAVIVVHLYGQCADMDAINEVCARYEVAVLEDAAEAVGASYKNQPAGSLSPVAAFSFNGNKIITTTGGGMLIAEDENLANKARFWATQARDAGIAYEHSETGYNYRLSNVLAGIGRGQLEVLPQRVAQRRAVNARYRAAFADLAGLAPMPEAAYGVPTHWLSCFTLDAEKFGATRDEIIIALDAANIEARPTWKPMHLQPLYADAECYGGAAAADIFARGICLPSSSSLTADQQQRVIDVMRSARRKRFASRAETGMNIEAAAS